MKITATNATINLSHLYKKEADESSRLTTALATIAAAGGVAAFTMLGCFRVNEKNQFVLRDTAEAFAFVQNMNELLRTIAG